VQLALNVLLLRLLLWLTRLHVELKQIITPTARSHSSKSLKWLNFLEERVIDLCARSKNGHREYALMTYFYEEVLDTFVETGECKDTRHDFLLCVGTQNRPKCLAALLSSLLRGRFGYPLKKLSVVILDHSSDEMAKANEDSIADALHHGLTVAHIKKSDMLRMVDDLHQNCPGADLSAYFGHLERDGIVTVPCLRNLARLYALRFSRRTGRKPLVLIWDDDNRLGANILVEDRYYEERFYPYFQMMSRVFDETQTDSVTAYYCGDAPVSTALILKYELADLLYFLKQACVKGAEASLPLPINPCMYDCRLHIYYGLSDAYVDPRIMVPRGRDRATFGHTFLRYGSEIHRLLRGGSISRKSFYSVQHLDDILRGPSLPDTKAPGANRCYRLTSSYFDVPHVVLDDLRRIDLLPMIQCVAACSSSSRWRAVPLPVMHERAEHRYGVEEDSAGRFDLSGELKSEYLGAELFYMFEKFWMSSPSHCRSVVSFDCFQNFRNTLWQKYVRMFDDIRTSCLAIIETLSYGDSFWRNNDAYEAATNQIRAVVDEIRWALSENVVVAIAERLGIGSRDCNRHYERMVEYIGSTEELSRQWAAVVSAWQSVPQ